MNKNWTNQLPLKEITQITPVHGGDVNDAYRIDCPRETYFLLVQKNRSEDFYSSEIAGLESFKKAGIQAPEVISSGEINQDAFLLLTYLEEGRGKQSDLGKLVAKLHQNIHPEEQFGFDYPHMGSDITFDNQWTDSWTELFVMRRLDELSKALQQKQLWNKHDIQQYQLARQIIVEKLDQHTSEPSLLHGDLWGGNYMFLSDGSPALFDPSCLYGDRELDIGVTTVFGGYDANFYESYQEVYLLKSGYEARLEFYRLYYLMIHLLKFGNRYAGSVSHSLEKIIRNS